MFCVNRGAIYTIYGRPNIAKDVGIREFSVIDGSGGLTIEKGVTLSVGVKILTHDYAKGKREEQPVYIHRNAFIGTDAIILMGVTIGEGAVIGAGSVVTKNAVVPAGETWAGIPARRIS